MPGYTNGRARVYLSTHKLLRHDASL